MSSAAGIGAFDSIPFGAGIPDEDDGSTFASIVMNGEDLVRCGRCGFGGCDVKVSGCGCTLHARCTQLKANGSLDVCPLCSKPMQALVLIPMDFRGIDEARRAAEAVPGRGTKRKSMDGGGDSVIEVDSKVTGREPVTDKRTGRWTNEEMALCDKLMAKFETGELPLPDGIKLNEFLGNMLKSKQSRLTKKMKNAKLSSKTFRRLSGFLNESEGREFSELEESFFKAVMDPREREEIKFHMQKEWREHFSHVCVTVGQRLDADAWLSSVEDMDRRASKEKDAARMAKRKLMMGVALRTDAKNLEEGVFIEKAYVLGASEPGDDLKDFEDLLDVLAEDHSLDFSTDFREKSALMQSAPFLSKVTTYLQRHSVPFEHVDLWVPSYVPADGSAADPSNDCRLCYAGHATVERLIKGDRKTSRPLSQDEMFNLFSFGDYSHKFSFAVGCGLPGRVYETGRPTWEQQVHNAPSHHFERCGGARQWGIKTVLGIPIASPTVGRIVVTLYSLFDRVKDEDLVTRLSEEFTRLMPSPKWKLVVDIGEAEGPPALQAATTAAAAAAAASGPPLDAKDSNEMSPLRNLTASSTRCDEDGRDPRVDEVVSLLGKYMPSDPLSPNMQWVNGFMSLRLLLLRSLRSVEEEELVKTVLDSFSSYTAGGRDESDIAVLLARDFLFLSQQTQQQQHSLLGMGQNLMTDTFQAPGAANSSGLSVFGLPSISSSLQNSPTLTPIPAPGSIDALSIVSN